MHIVVETTAVDHLESHIHRLLGRQPAVVLMPFFVAHNVSEDRAEFVAYIGCIG